MRLLALVAVLLALSACNKLGAERRASAPSLAPSPQVAGIIAVQPAPGRLVGPPFNTPQLAVFGPLMIAVASGDNQVANVGSRCTSPLTVLVTDGAGVPVKGAYVTFDPATRSLGPGGQGTATSGAAGQASVYAIPSAQGAALVKARAVTTYLLSNDVTFSVTGQ